MRKQDALFLALAVATIAFAFAFAYPAFTPQSVIWYYPLDHRWALALRPRGVAMDFYGRTLQAACAWCAALLVTLPIARRVRQPGQRALLLVGAWALIATVFVMLFFAWTLYNRVPVPADIPSWYRPR
jgi:hypothetical protein